MPVRTIFTYLLQWTPDILNSEEKKEYLFSYCSAQNTLITHEKKKNLFNAKPFPLKIKNGDTLTLCLSLHRADLSFEWKKIWFIVHCDFHKKFLPY